jgi:glycosyltransferase involved in cell wall biosynthesis
MTQPEPSPLPPLTASRILVVFWGESGAGIRYAYRVARELAAQFGADTVTVSISSRNAWLARTSALGVTVDQVSVTPARRNVLRVMVDLPRQLWKFLRLLRGCQPQVVVVPLNFGQAWALAATTALAGSKLVYVAHDAQPHPGDHAPLYQRVSQWLIGLCASRIVAPSAFVAGQAPPSLPRRAAGRIDVCPIASVALRRVGQPRQLADGPIRFLFVGRLMRYKGLDLLAQAATLLEHRDDWRLTIAGQGPEQEAIRQTFARHPQVDLSRIGYVTEDEIDALLESSDVVVAPYVEASQSGVIGEGQIYGLPAVVTPVGALAEQVAHGAAGWIAASATGAAVATAMLEAIEGRDAYAAKSASALAQTSEHAGGSKWAEIIRRAQQRN